jgi:hypothetical protein
VLCPANQGRRARARLGLWYVRTLQAVGRRGCKCDRGMCDVCVCCCVLQASGTVSTCNPPPVITREGRGAADCAAGGERGRFGCTLLHLVWAIDSRLQPTSARAPIPSQSHYSIRSPAQRCRWSSMTVSAPSGLTHHRSNHISVSSATLSSPGESSPTHPLPSREPTASDRHYELLVRYTRPCPTTVS